jgi:hypothetical protein
MRLGDPSLSIRRICTASLALLALIILGMPSPAVEPVEFKGAVLHEWNFDQDPTGKIAKDFKASTGEWSVVADGKNRVLAQTAKNDDSTFNIALVEETNFRDIDLSVRLKAVAGKVDQGGGVVWRARDVRNYYLCRFNPLESNFRLYKVVDGKRTQLESAKVPGDAEWHTLRITATGSAIQCFLDGKLHLEADDTTFRGAGQIGLWSKADAQTHFDDLVAAGVAVPRKASVEAAATREFEIRNNCPWLGGHEIDLWGLRCGNALFSEATTERHIRNFDNMAAHGINLVGCYIQGVNAGWPNGDAGIDGFTRDGRFMPEVARRLERLIREADRRGMVIMVGVLTPRKDQDFYDDAAIHRAVEEAARFLVERRLKNVFVDLCHEFNNPERMDKEFLREPNGPEKKAKLTQWFKAIAPDIEVGICPFVNSGTADSYSGMEVRMIQKDMPIPSEGFVVNVEPVREDAYQNDGIFNQTNLDNIFANCRRYREAPHAVFMFHAAFIQGITNFSGTAPHAEMGGYGTGPNDRGVRFYYEWVRDHVGRWEYPRHVPVDPEDER